MTVSIRLAGIEDIPAALELCRLSGWNQKPEDWRRLIQYEPSGCFVAESQGRVVGTVTTTRYGQALAWIGMMLVHPDYRRQGIATDLMNRSLEYLRGNQVRCIKLDATPEGSHVYQRLGFAEEWSMRRWRREGVSSGHNESPDHNERSTVLPKRERVAASSLDLYRELDQQAFGVDRWDWILRLLPDSDLECHSSAMGMLRSGFLADYLGPVIAAESESARAVVQALLSRTSANVFWDSPDPNQDAIQVAQSLRFEPVRQLTRMWTGDHLVQADLHRLFALVDPAVG